MKPLENVFEATKSIAKNGKEKGLNLIKKFGVTALVLASLASCKKDDPDEGLPNQKPKIEHNIDSVDSTKAKVFVKFEDPDGQVVSGLWHLVRELPHGKIQGDTPFTDEQIKQGNGVGFQMNFEGLIPNTEYKLVIESVTDNEGAEANKLTIPFTTEKGADPEPEPVFNYTVNTDINNVITWDDAVNGMVIPTGTVLGTVETTKEVTKDGVVDNTISTDVKYEYTGEFSDDIEMQGSNIVNINPLPVDHQIDGETNTNVANGINLKVKTTLENAGEEKATDTDTDKVEVLDGATYAPFVDATGTQILVEKNNGELFQDYKDAGILYSSAGPDDAISINSGGMIQIANASNGRWIYQPVQGVPDMQFTAGTHIGKSLHMVKLEKILHILDEKLVENGITIDNSSLNQDIFGLISAQLSDSDFEDYNGTSVKIKDSAIDRVAGTIVVKRLQEMGVTVQ